MRDADRSCLGKDAFPTKEEAHRRIVALVRTGGSGLRAYLCDHCRRWHVGHQPARRKARTQLRARPK